MAKVVVKLRLVYSDDDGYTTQEAVDDYYPGYAETFTRIGKERGWPPVNRSHFDAQTDPRGALLVGGPAEIAEKNKKK